MLGFMLLPLLGNVAEHFVAVTAAWKGLAELSLSVAVGSASQVGMVVAPAAVLFECDLWRRGDFRFFWVTFSTIVNYFGRRVYCIKR